MVTRPLPSVAETVGTSRISRCSRPGRAERGIGRRAGLREVEFHSFLSRVNMTGGPFVFPREVLWDLVFHMPLPGERNAPTESDKKMIRRLPRPNPDALLPQVQPLVQLEKRLLPTASDGALADLEQLGDLRLRPA